MKLITTKEAAAQLGVSVLRVQQLIWAGRLPAEKMGRDYFIKEDDLQLVAERKPGRPRKARSDKPAGGFANVTGEETKLLSVKQAADALGVNRQRVQQLIEAKRLPAEKVGAFYVIREADLELVRERKVGRPPKVETETIEKSPARASKKKSTKRVGKA